MCKNLEPVLECHEANFETGDGYRVGGGVVRCTNVQRVRKSST